MLQNSGLMASSLPVFETVALKGYSVRKYEDFTGAW